MMHHPDAVELYTVGIFFSHSTTIMHMMLSSFSIELVPYYVIHCITNEYEHNLLWYSGATTVFDNRALYQPFLDIMFPMLVFII